jgi:hypothetical protein
MKPNALALALCFASAAAFVLPDGAQARRFGGGSFHAANIHAHGVRPGWHGSGTHWAGNVRPGWHGAGTRWSGGHYHGGRYYGWGAAAAGVAAGAAAGAALYNSASCYQQQQVWNGYAYVWQTVNVC